MLYRFTPGPFSGPVPLLHPTPPPLRVGRSGPAETVRSVTREATCVLQGQERVPAPDPGRYHRKPSSVSGRDPRATGVARSSRPRCCAPGRGRAKTLDADGCAAKTGAGAADVHHASRVIHGAQSPVPAVPDGGPPLPLGTDAQGQAATTGARSVFGAGDRAPAADAGPTGTDRAQAEHNSAAGEEEHHNEIAVAGRITAEPRFRELPSGDHLATWRICVARHPSTRFRGRGVDSITCVSFEEGLHEHLRGWRLGDVVDVRGALRRRTWRGTAGIRSVCEIEATSVRLVRARRKGKR